MHSISTGTHRESSMNKHVSTLRWMRKLYYVPSSLKLRRCQLRQLFILLASVDDVFATKLHGHSR
jgi:hypothetical protein